MGTYQSYYLLIYLNIYKSYPEGSVKECCINCLWEQIESPLEIHAIWLQDIWLTFTFISTFHVLLKLFITESCNLFVVFTLKDISLKTLLYLRH